MHWFFLFSFLYVFKKYLNSQLSGIDERFIFYKSNFDSDNITILQILKIHETTEKIKFLESNNISIDDKLYEIVNKNVPEVINIINGGLFNDWEFDFPN